MAPPGNFGPGTPGLKIGLGVKFFRSGVQSANFVAANRLTPFSSYNFFPRVPMFNHHWQNFTKLSKNPKINFLFGRLCSGGSCINKVGISHMCAYDQNGVEAEQNIFPFKVGLFPG